MVELHPRLVPGAMTFDCPACRAHRVVITFRTWGKEGWARVGTLEEASLQPSITIYDVFYFKTGEKVRQVHWAGVVAHGQVHTHRADPPLTTLGVSGSEKFIS